MPSHTTRLTTATEKVAATMREGLGGPVDVDPEDLFRYVYSEPTPQLREQAAMLRDERARENQGA